MRTPGVTTAAEARHLARVAALGCVLCELQGYGSETPAEVHHVRGDAANVGGAQRASHYLTMPLCPTCHRGPTGVHGDRWLLKKCKTTELGMLALTIEKLQK